MKSSWISTKVKLPRKGREVLAYTVWGDGHKTFDVTEYDGDPEYGGWEMGSAKDYRVTHWQPLVKP